jgi:hypothetical protein
MSQWKKEYKIILCILYPIRMMSTIVIEDSPNDRHQTSASRIYMHVLVFGLEKGPHLDTVNCPVDNL